MLKKQLNYEAENLKSRNLTVAGISISDVIIHHVVPVSSESLHDQKRVNRIREIFLRIRQSVNTVLLKILRQTVKNKRFEHVHVAYKPIDEIHAFT